MGTRQVKTPAPLWIRHLKRPQISEIQSPQYHLHNLGPRLFKFHRETLYLPPVSRLDAALKSVCYNALNVAGHFEWALNSGVMKRFTIPISRYINALTAENDSQSAEILSAIFNPGMGSQHRDGTSVHSMDVNMLPIASLADSIDWTMLNDISRRATTAKRLQYSE